MNMGRMGFDSRRMSDCCLFRVRFCLNIRCKCKHGTAAITSPMVVVVAKGGGGAKGVMVWPHLRERGKLCSNCGLTGVAAMKIMPLVKVPLHVQGLAWVCIVLKNFQALDFIARYIWIVEAHR